MAKTKREYILVTCFFSGAAAVLSFVSLGTEFWITSDVETVITGSRSSYVRYGLFSGTMRQSFPTSTTFLLDITCNIGKNVCAMLCGDSDSRSKQLDGIYNDDATANFDNSCPQIKSVNSLEILPSLTAVANYDKEFINAGVWISTIVFIIISAAMGCISSALALWNTVTNPIQVYLSVYGLYFYNAIALLCIIIVVTLWGIMYSVTTIHNVAVFYTLSGDMTSDNLATLGYSYWLNFASMVLYIASICSLYLRNYLITKQPVVDVHNIEDNGLSELYLY